MTATLTDSFVPSFYDPSKCGEIWDPDLNAAAEAGVEYAKTNNIKSTATDKRERIILNIIDMQNDFCHPETGKLFVPGSVEDVDRTCRFIYNNIDRISHIVASLDTHYLYQPFHRFNWQAGPNNTLVRNSGNNKGVPYNEGDHPDPFTVITLSDLTNGVWRPTRNARQMHEMVRRLQEEGRAPLCIWPLHCLLGTPGHALNSSLMEAIYFHAAARNDQYYLTEKGTSRSSEHYGIVKAEVRFANDDATHVDKRITDKYSSADKIYILGQARTHCVLRTLGQIVEMFSDNSPELLENIHVVEDCMSNVPNITDDSGNTIVDFDTPANEEFDRYAKDHGIKSVKSTDLIE